MKKQENLDTIMEKIPIVIQIGIYYMLKGDGKITFDVESMEAEFNEKINELQNKFCDK